MRQARTLTGLAWSLLPLLCGAWLLAALWLEADGAVFILVLSAYLVLASGLVVETRRARRPEPPEAPPRRDERQP